MGHECILSLARGAVRERMLFNRLAEAEVVIPDYEIQKSYAVKLKSAQEEIATMKAAIVSQLQDLKSLPHRIVALSYGDER